MLPAGSTVLLLTAKSKPGKDAGSVRIRRIRTRPRTQPGTALQAAGHECSSGREHLVGEYDAVDPGLHATDGG